MQSRLAPLKILMVHNGYQHRGGETVVAEAQEQLLRDRGHEVVTYARGNDEIDRFGLRDKAAFLAETVYSRRTYREVRALVQRERPDVAHVHNVFPLISPSVYHGLRDECVPIVQAVHNYRLMCPNGLFYTRGETCERCMHGNTIHAVRLRCYRDSYALSALYATTIGTHRFRGTFDLIDRFVVPADFAAEKLVESGVTSANRVSVMHHFLPDPLPHPGSFASREPSFVYMGRLSVEKGVWTLIDAMRGAPQLRLTLFGAGPLEDPIRDYLRRERISHIVLGGFISGEAKWDALRSALAVVIPSDCYEVSPFSLAESLMAGTPLVAPAFGNFPNAIADQETGLLFRPRDAGDLRDKLTWLAAHRDRALAMGTRARSVAETRYTADAHYAGLDGIYRALARPAVEGV